MKTINRLCLLMILTSVLAVTGCNNTAHGLHQDWRNNMQSVANDTGN